MDVSNDFGKLQQVLFNLFKSQDPKIGKFDIVFDIGGKKLYGYRSSLPVLSPTFASLLSDRWNKKNDEPIPISRYSFNDFYQFLTFIYSGQCELTAENIVTMVDIAEFYQVQFFKDYCDSYAAKMTLNVDDIFQQLEFAMKYSLVKLCDSIKTCMVKDFVNLGNSEDFLNAKKETILEIVLMVKDGVEQDTLFHTVYKWAEKQAKDKQAFGQNGNLNDAIKSEISEFLSLIDFEKMEHKFVLEFVVPRCSIFPSSNDLTEILKSTYYKKVTVTNDREQKLHANLIPEESVVRVIKAIRNPECMRAVDNRYAVWKTKCEIPSTPSALKKRDDVYWYLFYFADGDIGVGSRSFVDENNSCYLIAEMFPHEAGFQLSNSCKIKVE